MDENQKRLEALRRTKKRRKQIDITFILAALALLFLLAGIHLGQGLYYLAAVLCALFTFMLIFDLRRDRRLLQKQQEREAQEQKAQTQPESEKNAEI